MNCHSGWSVWASGMAVLAFLGGGLAPAAAQRPSRRPIPVRATAPGAELGLKGIWEPVNFPEDLTLWDVFFVTVDEGWAAGDAGTILHTTDGGATWSAQLGGDPNSSEKAFADLRFVDATHGWAVQDKVDDRKLFRTTDGQTWSEVGVLYHAGLQAYNDYLFTSPRDGVSIVGDAIYQTHDAGRHWLKVFECQTKTEIEGLTKAVSCDLHGVHFPTPLVGYAIGANRDIEDRIFVAKTRDGGATWTLTLPEGPDLVDSFGSVDVKLFFTDENTGVMVVQNGSKFFTTQDGGQTWRGVVGTAGPRIKFADPSVAWSMSKSRLSFSTDGGNRWTSRELSFPAPVRGFSLPRRDRAYVVGDHGMIYRYRLVPAETVLAKAIDAPAMPGFVSPLDTKVTELGQQLSALETSVANSPPSDSASGATAAPAPSTGDPAQMSGADATPTAFVTSCCGKRLGGFELILKAVTGLLPDFIAKYRNLNLLVQGLRIAGALPDKADSLKQAIRTFKTARDRDAANAALAGLKNVLEDFRAAADTALQRPPVDVQPADSARRPPTGPSSN